MEGGRGVVRGGGGGEVGTLAEARGGVGAKEARLAAKVRCPLSPGFSCWLR
eukprot:COSAG01_NODE_6440_length_3664_cov_7.580645_1_plen_50_part_10